jgi:hypothetical protein
MSERNPSFGLTNEQVDDIVDRVLRGKYEKRPPTTEEILSTGLTSLSRCWDYVGVRWRGTLTKTGHTMRRNNLWGKLSGCADQVWKLDDPRLVWEMRSSHDSAVICYATGSSKAAERWTNLFFQWTLPERAHINIYYYGFGGVEQAAILNTSLLPETEKRINGYLEQARVYEQKAERLRTTFDVLAGAAIHLQASADTAKGPMQTE